MITADNGPLRRRRRAWTSAVLVLAAMTSQAAPPAPGMLLIASPKMHGSWFAESVILLVQHDASGTVGLVINRPTDMVPADVLPDISGIDEFQDRLYVGGPVEAYGIMMLVRSASPPRDAQHIFANVYASGSLELLREMVGGGGSAGRVRLYAGYAGWVPGQLEAEIRRGSWSVAAAAEQHVFTNDPDGIWKTLVPPARPIIVRRTVHITRF